ncbi:MAG: acyltransferase family protein [Cyclobacteriaceae bacterium]|nr:acyltransferase family protein [Cyclobacteriaceae bacterium]
MRRYDIDWLRVIAIGLLLIYHVAIGFQPWGVMIGFITTQKPWTALWTPMMLLNVWRIPLLFFVSGMGVYFAMHQRNWRQLISERALRILLPYVFGMFVIVPVHVLIWRYHFNMKLLYSWNPGHLWFLGNIFCYVLLLSPVLFYLKRKESGVVEQFIKKVFSHPAGLLVVVGAFVLEVIIVKPVPFELYAMTSHGFFLGLLAFFFGFCFVLSGAAFWQMIQRWRWFFVIIGLALFLLRVYHFGMNTPGYLIVLESLSWILAMLAFGSKYLNKPGKALTYLSEAAYPVYIVHMIFLYLGSHLIFKWMLPSPVQFVLVLLFTLAGCFALFEVIRRAKWLRPLFGLKMQQTR